MLVGGHRGAEGQSWEGQPLCLGETVTILSTLTVGKRARNVWLWGEEPQG